MKKIKKNKKTLREVLLPNSPKVEEIQDDMKLGLSIKMVLYIIILNIVEGVIFTVIRELQFERNIQRLSPYYIPKQFNYTKHILKNMQLYENLTMIVIVGLVSLGIMIYYVNKIEKIGDKDNDRKGKRRSGAGTGKEQGREKENNI